MILSFSIPEMLPMLEAGLAQTLGEDIGGRRVKGQTIRRRGPRAEALLAHDPVGHTIPYDLQLWWKSRTAGRRRLGTIPSARVRVYPLQILHTIIVPPDAPEYVCYRIDGPRGWRRADAMLFWSPGDGGENPFTDEARRDGFETAQDFADFFVPYMGDVFAGILIRWVGNWGQS